MQHATRALPERAGVVETAKRTFFRNFFPLLVGFVALAEWTCIAWILHVVGVGVPWPAHLVAPPLIYVANRALVRRTMARGRDRIVRAYVALAFGSIFCALFLAAAGIVAAAGYGLAPAAVGAAYYWLVNAGFATIAGTLVWGYTFGSRELTVTELRVPVRALPAAFDGFRLVHLSDLHLGTHLDPDELAKHVERVNALAPDLICITGDLVDRAETCATAFPVLARLHARHGVVVTLGNHDFAAGADAVTRALRRLTPFTVLRDARHDVVRDGAVLALAGVDDLGHDWARGVLEHPALPGLARDVADGDPFVVLSHRPDCFAQAARLGAILVLSGHTHGGQLALPFRVGGRRRNLAEFITRFDRGLYRDGDATLYVNRGLGFTAQRIRLFTPREIACFTLTAS
ncbi:MAG TPA: metallophosphoesterase [Candidatus Binatia bacterium]|nr:metallophosphoesterase [Candidatus Binatia bacterium]